MNGRITIERVWPVFGAAWLLATTGCKQEGVRVYEVPKEQPRQLAAAAPGSSPHDHGLPKPPAAHVHWAALPAHWQERPVSGGMRIAAISITGADGQTADLAILALPEVPGMELEIVNMWREQAGLGFVTAQTVAEVREGVAVAGSPGYLYDMAGTQPADGSRTIVATVSRDRLAWYFKLTGPDALVTAEKPALKAFLETVELHVDAHEPAPAESLAASTPAPATPGKDATATLPAGWKALSPGMMQTARFELPGGTQATVSTAGGDLLSNVNRWRGQLQLEPVAASGLAGITQPLTLASGAQATVVDMNGPEDRMVAVIVPRGAQSVFYKLMGPPENVARDRDAFLQFAQSAQY